MPVPVGNSEVDELWESRVIRSMTCKMGEDVWYWIMIFGGREKGVMHAFIIISCHLGGWNPGAGVSSHTSGKLCYITTSDTLRHL